MKAYVYVRVSTARQEAEGYSLEAQLELCREYASRAALVIEEEFVEVESASSTGRPRFAALLQAVRRTPGCVVLAQSTDRLYRNMEDAGRLERTGVAIHLVHEGGETSTASAMGRFTGRLKASLAALYSERLGEEVVKGLAAKAAQGYWPTVAPVGYLNQLVEGRRVIIPDPDRAPLVRELFLRCAMGEGTKELAAWAKGVGLRSPRASRTLSQSRIGIVLAHPVYCGMVVWKGRQHPGKHEPLVTRSEWNAAQDALAGRRRGSVPRPRREPLPYAGSVILCGGCLSSITGERKTQRHGRRYVYYRCTGKLGEGCPRRYIREGKLEELLCDAFGALALEEDTIEGLRLIMRDIVEGDQEERKERRRELRKRVRYLEEKIRQSSIAAIEGRISSSDHARLSQEWGAEIEAAELQVDGARAGEAYNVETAMALLRVAAGASETLPTFAPSLRREVLAFYGREWLLAPDAGSVSVKWAYPWGALDRTPEIGSSSVVRAPTSGAEGVWLPGRPYDRTSVAALACISAPEWLPAALDGLEQAANLGARP